MYTSSDELLLVLPFTVAKILNEKGKILHQKVNLFGNFFLYFFPFNWC